jgi:putative ABC transport system substrate-binding protein
MSGIKDGLALENIYYEEVIMHSNRDRSMAVKNLRKLDAMGLDVIYSLSSAGTKIAYELKLDTPIIANVINHPTSLGVDESKMDGTTNLTGTSYYIDAKKQLKLYLSLFPGTKKVGMIFDSNNPAGYLSEEPFMREACAKFGIGMHSMGVTDKAELAAAAVELVGKGVNMIVIPTNRLVYSNLKTVLEVTDTNNIPVLSMNKQGVEYGALAALFADTYNLGRQSSAMARQIIVDKKASGMIAFEYIPEPDVILNLTTADKLDYEFPAEVLASAAIVLQ